MALQPSHIFNTNRHQCDYEHKYNKWMLIFGCWQSYNTSSGANKLSYHTNAWYSIRLHYLVCYSSDVYIRPWLYSLVGVKASKNKHSMLTVNFIHTAWITSKRDIYHLFIASVDIINIMIIGIQSSLPVCYNYNSSNIWVCQNRNDFLKQESRCWQAEERK